MTRGDMTIEWIPAFPTKVRDRLFMKGGLYIFSKQNTDSSVASLFQNDKREMTDCFATLAMTYEKIPLTLPFTKGDDPWCKER